MNKPYVSVDMADEENPQLLVRIFNPDGWGLSEAGTDTEDEHFVVNLRIDPDGSPANPFHFDLVAHGYDSGISEKVTVKIINEEDNLLGMCTVIPRFFKAPSEEMTYRPFVWLKYVPESMVANLHFVIGAPEGSILSMDGEPNDEPEDGRSRTLNYLLEVTESGDLADVFGSHTLSEETNYDPVKDDIIIYIVDAERSKKGKAAVHHSEGDTSGGE